MNLTPASRPAALLLLVLGCSCAGVPPAAAPDPWPKVELDLSELDPHGRRGSADGRVSLAYEFCIPDTESCRAEVAAIDPSIRFMPGSPGRIGAGPQECLCVGETGRHHTQVLARLAALPYVHRIVACHFE